MRIAIVVEIKNGSLANVYADDDLNIVVVDHDEEGSASALVIPEKMCNIPPDTRRLVIDAVKRPQQKE